MQNAREEAKPSDVKMQFSRDGIRVFNSRRTS